MSHFGGNLDKRKSPNQHISVSNITVLKTTLSSHSEAVKTKAKNIPKVKNKAISVIS